MLDVKIQIGNIKFEKFNYTNSKPLFPRYGISIVGKDESDSNMNEILAEFRKFEDINGYDLVIPDYMLKYILQGYLHGR